MTDLKTAAVILAAGHGTRMKSALPKVMHEIGGRAMIAHVIDGAAALAPERMAVVIGDHAPEVGDFARTVRGDIAVAVQAPPQGTAHAVMQALPALKGFSGAVLVLYADTPLVTPQTLQALAGEIENGAAVAVLGFTPEEPGAYGRLKLDEKGALAAIVEAKDASPEELEITLCNSGVMAIDAAFLMKRLKDIGNDNAKGEYYLTDIVALARADGQPCAVIEADADEVLGVNSRVELAEAEAVFQDRMREAAMAAGATLADPLTVYFSYDTKLGKDVTVGQHVVFGPGVTVADNAEIKPFSHLEGASVAGGASAGPFARLRPGAALKTGAKVGNFVEIKKAVIGDGAKVSHLSYIGDADVGAEANIGAGTITCNYDGYGKFKTVIGKGAFIGSNSALVAPVTIGERAYVGSGSVVTEDVAPGDLALARARQTAIKGWAARFHDKHKARKK
ncbi:bifunctional UDP-N-acetylglucosamine diphosphorylase/glucosamine-1-phosphate N-acetyltransferase GlmU [Hyphococcus luteus]|uniref:Bifunctional protein GlmU n=1 Tax=Hyphococcus luteus TaxID=2058213 RepID=A0A2S7KAW9_9PROT|nr:bifunctional UDP-N-acetylglucosamine diphosphorylase/glucosamine-1-phosphate N-acetyltransferase GlmU [Marinicaulis flavus]PQA89650.1 bifunctional N-acetylglucosamine-1-phosphate uridyltransferase/glucosamine-1-phosphate acetyltransferase [Marinicaulis flavus]